MVFVFHCSLRSIFRSSACVVLLREIRPRQCLVAWFRHETACPAFISEKSFDPLRSSMLSFWSHGGWRRMAPKNQSSHPSASGSVERGGRVGRVVGRFGGRSGRRVGGGMGGWHGIGDYCFRQACQRDEHLGARQSVLLHGAFMVILDPVVGVWTAVF